MLLSHTPNTDVFKVALLWWLIVDLIELGNAQEIIKAHLCE
jgi:hypothetical protein